MSVRNGWAYLGEPKVALDRYKNGSDQAVLVRESSEMVIISKWDKEDSHETAIQTRLK